MQRVGDSMELGSVVPDDDTLFSAYLHTPMGYFRGIDVLEGQELLRDCEPRCA